MADTYVAKVTWDISLTDEFETNPVGKKNNFWYFHEKNKESIVGKIFLSTVLCYGDIFQEWLIYLIW